MLRPLHRPLIALLAALAGTGCQDDACDLGSAPPALGGIVGAIAGGQVEPAPSGGSVTATPNPDGTVTITTRDASGAVISEEHVVPTHPGPGWEGEPAAGPVGSGNVYGKSHHGQDGGGWTEILDADGNQIGCKFFGPPEPVPGWEGVPEGGALSWTEDGTRQILDADLEVIAEIPPVAEGTDPKDCVERTWVPLPQGGGFWICHDREGRVVDTEYLGPSHPDVPGTDGP